MIRNVFVVLHRWVGLLMAVFLVIVGVTGSLLAFQSELEHVFAPQLFAKPHPGEALLDLATLAERAASLVPHADVVNVVLTEPNQVKIDVYPKTDPATGAPYEIGFTQLYVDPWTGAELGRRTWADLSEGLINFMPFIFRLHASLLLDRTGVTILGVIAVAWTIDCFVSFYLSLPVSLSGFRRKWASAWLVKRGAGFYYLNFDLHRASGLWLWPLLFVFAWSSVMLFMPPVYEWVTSKLFDYRSPAEDYYQARFRRAPKPHPALDWRAAQAAGDRLMTEQAAKQGFTVGDPSGLSYKERTGVYHYYVHSSRDVSERPPRLESTIVTFDGDTGELVQFYIPTGVRSGNTITSWLRALHTARAFGMPYRIFVFALGLVITMLSATGVYIWWKKKSAGRLQKARDASDGALLEQPAAK